MGGSNYPLERILPDQSTNIMAYKNRDELLAFHRKYNLERYHRRRMEFVELLGGSCACCGAKERLQFHHKNPSEKAFTISRMLNYSLEKVKQEVLKCELLCEDCHIEEHRYDNA